MGLVRKGVRDQSSKVNEGVPPHQWHSTATGGVGRPPAPAPPPPSEVAVLPADRGEVECREPVPELPQDPTIAAAAA